jgi:hypothetical protein
MVPRTGDLLIRTSPSHDEYSKFVLLDAITQRLVAGPTTFNDAIRIACDLISHGGRIWQQFADARGRPLGPPSRLELQL